MTDEPKAGLDEIRTLFSGLWQALVNDGAVRRRDDERRLLVDHVRDALDRGEARLSDTPPDIIANTFVIEAQLHDGPLTSIYRARHRDLGSPHAVKVLHPHCADDPVSRQLLLREAGIGLSLRHPHVAATQALLRQEDGRPAIILEWCENSLADRIAAGPLSAGYIITVMDALLKGLSAMHERSLVHCDLSPSNLLFSGAEPESMKVADFGIALQTGRSHEDLDLRFAGRPHFAAPEQKEGGTVDARTDLYAAGCILSLLLLGCSDPAPQRLHALAGHLSRPRAEDRPESAKAALQMLGDLQNIASETESVRSR